MLSTVMSAFARAGRWEDVLELMRHGALQPDATCYLAAVDACEESYQWRSALSLLFIMSQVQVRLGQVFQVFLS